MEQPAIPSNQSLHNSSASQRPLSGLEFLALLLKHKIFLLVTTLLSGGIALGIAMTFPNWYDATVNFVPPNNPQSGMSSMLGNMSSALKDFGLGKLGSKGEAYSYIVILQSRSFQDSIINRFDLAKEYELPDSLRDEVRASLKKNMEISYMPDGNYTITCTSKDPQKAADMANYSVQIANTIALNLQRQEASVNRRYMEQRLNNADSTLTRIGDSLKRFAKKNQVFSPLDQAKALTTALAEMKAGVIKQEIQVQTYRNAYGEDDPSTKLQKQNLEELRAQVYKAEHEAGFGGNFAMTDAMDVGVPYLRLFTDFEAMSKVKAFLLPMLEQARLDEFRQAPTMYVLDAAVPATKKSRPKRSLIAGGAALGVFILGSLFILLRYRLSSLTI
jgi:tyrosine-protein kinase Etk/Wzc